MKWTSRRTCTIAASWTSNRAVSLFPALRGSCESFRQETLAVRSCFSNVSSFDV